MWYNDILIIVMGVIAVLMILMAMMVGHGYPGNSQRSLKRKRSQKRYS